MTRRRVKRRRTRSKREKGEGGGSMPSRSLSREDVEKAAEVHSKRSSHAQRIDEAMTARTAESLDQWLSEPNRYDITGVDYPGKNLQKALEEIEPKKPKKINPFRDSDTAKEHIRPIVEEYHKAMGLTTPIENLRLSARNRGHPAKVIHHDDPDESPIIRFNYEHFQQLYEDLDDPETVERYMRYAVAHELAHVQQHEEFSMDEVRRIKKTMGLHEFEDDADARASILIGKPIEDIEKEIRKTEQKLLKKDLAAIPPEDKPPVTKAEKPMEPHPDSLKYNEIPVGSLKELPGIGPQTIENLEKFGYRNLGEIYSDSAQFHGLLAQCPGIGEHTAKMLHKQIDQHLQSEPATKTPGKKPQPTENKRVNDIINQIKAEKPHLTDEAIHELMEKENSLHANLLTDEATALLVADQLGVKIGSGEPGEQPFSIPPEYREWVSEADSQADLDTVMAQANKDQKLTESQRIRVAGLVEEKRETLARGTKLEAPTSEDVSDILDHMYPDGNIGQTREELRDSVTQWIADKKGIDPDNPQSQYDEHMIANMELLSDQLIESMIDGHWFEEQNGKLYLEGQDRELGSIDPEEAKTKMRDIMEQNPGITDEEILDKLVEAYDIEPEAVDSFKSLARGRLENMPRPTEDVSLYDELRERKFWAYSGADGDLYRKHGLGGWRVQVYWGTDLAIQKKQDGRWVTIADLDTETPEDKRLAVDFIDEWMKEPEILDAPDKVTIKDLRTRAKIKALPQDQLNILRDNFKEGYRESLGVSIDHQIANMQRDLHDSLLDKGLEKDQISEIMTEFNEETITAKHRDLLNELQEEYLAQCDQYLSEASTDPLKDWKRAVELNRWSDASYQHAAEVVNKEYRSLQAKAKPKTPEYTGPSFLRPKDSEKRREYYQKAGPYTALTSMGTVDEFNIKDGLIQLRGMDPSHIAMNVSEIPNRLGIPDGEYAGKILNPDDLTTSLVKYPDKVEWKQGSKGGEIQITKKIKGKNRTVRIQLRQDEKPETLPDPRILYKAEAPVKLNKLRELLESSPEENIHLKTFEEDGKHVLRAWWNEERAGRSVSPISHTVTICDEIQLEEPIQCTFDQAYLETLLENLSHQGITEGTIHLVTDMPMKLETETTEFRNTYYQAPKVDASYNYYPDDPRAKITREDYPSKKSWRNQAIPYTAAIHVATSHGRGEPVINATQDHLSIKAINGEHTAMIEVNTPNLLNIKPGKYQTDYNLMEANKTTLRYPDKLVWDPELHQLQATKKDDKGYIDLKPGETTPPPPLPKAQEAATLQRKNLKKLKKAVNKALKNTKNTQGNPSIQLKSNIEGITLQYTQDGNITQETITTESIKPGILDTNINPTLLRDYLYLLENMNPEHISIKQHETGLLVIETNDNQTNIRYGIAPQIGA